MTPGSDLEPIRSTRSEGSPLREAVIGWGFFLAIVLVSCGLVAAALWGLGARS